MTRDGSLIMGPHAVRLKMYNAFSQGVYDAAAVLCNFAASFTVS